MNDSDEWRILCWEVIEDTIQYSRSSTWKDLEHDGTNDC